MKAFVTLLVLGAVSCFAVTRTPVATLTVTGATQIAAQNGVLAVSSTDSTIKLYQLGTWNLLATLNAYAGKNISVRSMAVQNNYIAAGLSNASIFIYQKPQTGWSDESPTAVLTASNQVTGSAFGDWVSVWGNTLVTGDYLANKAYVFVEPTSGWVSGTETAQLTPSNPVPGSDFGSGVAISGNAGQGGSLVSVTQVQTNPTIYLFQEGSGGWSSETETYTLTDPADTSGFYNDAMSMSNVVTSSFNINELLLYTAPWQDESSPAAILTAPHSMQALGLFGLAMTQNGKIIVACCGQSYRSEWDFAYLWHQSNGWKAPIILSAVKHSTSLHGVAIAPGWAFAIDADNHVFVFNGN